MTEDAIVSWVDEATRSLRAVGIDQIPVGALSEPFVGPETIEAVVASGTIDRRHLAEYADAPTHRRDGDPDLVDGAVLFIYLSALEIGWDKSRAPQAAFVEMLALFPNDGLLERLGWRTPRLPLTRRRAGQRLGRLLRNLVRELSPRG